MPIVTLAGSPSATSRSRCMLNYVKQRIGATHGQLSSFALDDFDPAALVQGRWDDPGVVALRDAVAAADAVVIATPVYQASFSGGLKLMLDLLPQHALTHKTVLALATGGSDHHLLMLDYALKPVLSSLGARHQLAGVYASPLHIEKTADGRYRLGESVRERLDEVIDELIESLAPVAKSRTRDLARLALA
ncbi:MULTISPECIES: NADPH-dependent FMN reductase [Salinicola]|uniref:NADPH-dependent FMN reductase n=1 Tax=Salinicola TaxID=404432 RepID=UPI000DA2277D|nr:MULTISPECIES: NADPH-dependent FMN reductase [Salinicola]